MSSWQISYRTGNSYRMVGFVLGAAPTQNMVAVLNVWMARNGYKRDAKRDAALSRVWQEPVVAVKGKGGHSCFVAHQINGEVPVSYAERHIVPMPGERRAALPEPIVDLAAGYEGSDEQMRDLLGEPHPLTDSERRAYEQRMDTLAKAQQAMARVSDGLGTGLDIGAISAASFVALNEAWWEIKRALNRAEQQNPPPLPPGVDAPGPASLRGPILGGAPRPRHSGYAGCCCESSLCDHGQAECERPASRPAPIKYLSGSPMCEPCIAHYTELGYAQHSGACDQAQELWADHRISDEDYRRGLCFEHRAELAVDEAEGGQP